MSNCNLVKMNPEVKAKWLSWLRDPNNKQARHILKDHEGFCCLGGLTDIYLKDGGKEWLQDYSTGPFYVFTQGEFKESSALPCEVQDWAGLEDTKVRYNRKLEFLTNLNDLAGLTFLEIADLIEEQL